MAPHLQRDERWRGYVSAAAGLGLRSQVAAPLQLRGDGPRGVLTMYSTTRGEIAPTAPLIAEALAAQTAGVLDSFREIENLQRALATRKTVGMALGLLMAQHHLDEEAALTVLRRHASRASTPVLDIAARIVTDGIAAALELGPEVAGAELRSRLPPA